MALELPEEIQAYYRDREVVARYLERRTAQPLNGALHQAQVRWLQQRIRERAPRCVVEIAPGPARLTAEITVPGVGVGFEFSDTMLAAARTRVGTDSRWRFVRSDAFRLPAAAEVADFIFSLRFVRRFHFEDRQRLYREIHRVLRPGGVLALDAQNRAVALPHRQERGLERYPVYDQLYDEHELRCEVEAAGFRVVIVQGMIKHFSLQRRLNRLRRLKLDWLARTLIETLEYVPGNSPSSWMLLAEKIV